MVYYLTNDRRIMEKENKLEYEFIASSKVVRYMINPQAADILAVLIYKYDYWQSKNEIVKYRGLPSFYIPYTDIEEETNYSKNIILKNLKLLEKEGLIKRLRQGLNKPNRYHLDKSKIMNYIKKHEKDYENGRLKIRNKGSVSVSEGFVTAGIMQNKTSGNSVMMVQEPLKSATTNNKNTNNRNTKKNTNHVNVGEVEEYDGILFEKTEKLTELIESIDETDVSKKKLGIEKIYKFLIELVPKFEFFISSSQDLEMIGELLEYELEPYKIADKISYNAQRIINGDLEERFGNFFVGLYEMNKRTEEKYF